MRTRTAPRRPQGALVGGVVLGSGKFGVVLSPPLDCGGGPPPAATDVTKLTSTRRAHDPAASAALEEETRPLLLAALAQADPAQAYTAYATAVGGRDDTALARLPAATREDIAAASEWHEGAASSTAELRYFNMPRLGGRVTYFTEDDRRHLRQGLARLHAHGVRHNDLHHLNLLRGRDARPRIIDFGLATTHDAPLDAALAARDERMLEAALSRPKSVSPKRRKRPRRSSSSGDEW